MQSRNTYSLVALLLLSVAACAKQNAGAGFDDAGDDDDDDTMAESGSGGKAGAGTAGSNVSLSGGTSVSGKGSGGTGGHGGGTTLPPVGTSGKSGGAGGGGGSGGKAGAGGAAGSSGSSAGGNVNMPIDGVSVTLDTRIEPGEMVSFVGGELHLNDDAGPPLPYADMKIRYYFTDDMAGATNPTSVMMNWSQCGSSKALGDGNCTGVVKQLAPPKAGADSYIELTCKGTGEELPTEGLCKISWKAGANGNSEKQNQSDDWSFQSANNIVVLIGNKIIWGVEPK